MGPGAHRNFRLSVAHILPMRHRKPDFCGAPSPVRHRNQTFCGAPSLVRHRKSDFCGAHGPVRHRKSARGADSNLKKVILWRTSHVRHRKLIFCGPPARCATESSHSVAHQARCATDFFFPDPTPPWIAFLVLHEENENDRSFKK